MSDTNNRPNKDGSLRGDDKDLPDRGTSVGMDPGADPATGGMSTEQSATNRQGRISGATQSDSESTPFGGDTRI